MRINVCGLSFFVIATVAIAVSGCGGGEAAKGVQAESQKEQVASAEIFAPSLVMAATCPIADQTTLDGVKASWLNCDQRKIYQYFKDYITPILDGDISSHNVALDVISEEVTIENIDKHLENNFLEQSFQAVDFLMEGAEELEKGNIAKALYDSSAFLARQVGAIVLLAAPEETGNDFNGRLSLSVELTESVNSTLSSAKCASFLESGADRDKCLNGIGGSIAFYRKAHGLLTPKDMQSNIDLKIDEALDVALSGTKVIADAYKLAKIPVGNKKQLKASLIALSADYIKMGSKVMLAHSSQGGKDNSVIVQSLTGTIDVVAEQLGLVSKCYGNGRGLKKWDCVHGLIKSSSRSLATGIALVFGTEETFRHVGMRAEILAVKYGMDQLLAYPDTYPLSSKGSDPFGLYPKYGIVFDGTNESTKRQSFMLLIPKVLDKAGWSGITGASNYTAWMQAIISGVAEGGSAFAVDKVISEIRLNANKAQTMSSPKYSGSGLAGFNLDMTGAISGKVGLEIGIDLDVLGVRKGWITCQAERSNYPQAKPFKADFSVDSRIFTINFQFDKFGEAGIACGVYRSGFGMYLGGGSVSFILPSRGWIRSPVNGRAYLRLPNCGTWRQCENAAVLAGGHLVTIRSQSENNWLLTNFGTAFYWIGLTDEGSEGSWRWVGGEPVTYTNWGFGEPNNASGFENYGHLNWPSVGVWNDADLDNSAVTSAIIERGW